MKSLQLSSPPPASPTRSASLLFGCLLTLGALGPVHFAAAGTDPSTVTAATPSATPEQPPEGLTTSDWSGIRAAYEATRHSAVEQEDGTLTARNPGQQWVTTFDGQGFTVSPDSTDWTWGLQLENYGFSTKQRAVANQAELSHDQGKVYYDWDKNLREWFVNDTRGLEQGWTIQQRPEGVRDGEPLHLSFSLRGDLKPSVAASGTSVAFLDSGGGTALNFGGLKAWDADGKPLAASFEPVPQDPAALQITVNESEARYPITIDPVAQQALLHASNGDTWDFFGSAVAVSGDTVVVGAYWEDSGSDPNTNGVSNSGAAYVFVRNGSTWSQQAILKAQYYGESEWFGFAVGISGDTIVVGAPNENNGLPGIDPWPYDGSAWGSGAAYVFIRSGSVWTQQAFIKASNPNSYDYFGWSVDVDGDTVVVGAEQESSSATGVNGNDADNSAVGSGAAYVFSRSGTTWSQQAYLKASNTGAQDGFGTNVATSGETVVVGAPEEDSNATGIDGDQFDNSAGTSGAVYVFTRSGTTWSQQAFVKASNTDAGDQFGEAVSISGNTMVVGASVEASGANVINGIETDNGAVYAGAAYVFTRSGTAWSQQAYIKPTNNRSGREFGRSISISGEKLVVGAPGYDDGVAYVFVRNGSSWYEQSILTPTGGNGHSFAGQVALSGDIAVFGDHSEATVASYAGGAYVFDVPTLTPPNAGDDAITVAEGGTATTLDGGGTSVLDNDTDPEPTDTLTVNTTPVTPPSYGSLTLNTDGTFSYTHDGSENLSDSFVYEVSDPAGDTDEGTVTITITPVNDNLPVASADSINVDEGATTSTLDHDGDPTSVLHNDSDADAPGDPLTAVLEDDVDLGTLILNSDGTFSYTHDGSEVFSDSFTYHLNDGLHDSNTVTVTITITPDNDTDGDDMDDDYEQTIIDADPLDDLIVFADVLPDDDFDGDGRTNLEEQGDLTDPTDRGSTLGLQVYYPFDGDTNDASGNDRHGILYGATPADGVTGNPNSAYRFDGSNDWVDMGFQASWAEATFSAWVKLESATGYSRIIEDGGGGGAHKEAFIAADATSPTQPNLDAARWNKPATLAAHDVDEEWTFVVGVFANNQTTIWVNGQSAQTTSGAPYGPVESVDHTYRIARARDLTHSYYKGLIDDVRIYSRALDSDEVAALYAAPDTTPRPDLAIGETGFRVLDQAGSEIANPSVGESVVLEVTVTNDGIVATDEPTEVRVFQDGAPSNLNNYDAAAFDVLGTGTISDNLQPDESRVVTIPWTISGSDRVSVLTAVAEAQSNRSTSQDNADNGTSIPLPKPEQTLSNNAKARAVQIGTPIQGAYGITVYATAPAGMLSGVQYALIGTAEYDFGGNNPVLGGLVEVSVDGQFHTTYTTGGSGSWSVLLDSLPVGIHTALIQVSDGNASGSKTLDLDVAAGPQAIDLRVDQIGYAGGTYRTYYETAWAVTGTGVTLKARVHNNGNTAAGAFDVEFKAPDGSTIATENVVGLAAGDRAWVTATSTWTPASDGSYQISATADSGAAIAETVETNNTRTATVHATADLPDLVVKDIDWNPQSPVQDQDGTYVATIQNLGSATISSGTSFDTRFTLAGTLVSTQGHTLAADLATGDTVAVETTITATGLSPGGTSILAEVDSGSVISEIDEGNNSRTETVTIRIALPDLRPYSLLYGHQHVSGLFFSPSNPITGNGITITCDIWNTGTIDIPTGSYQVDFTADGGPIATETLTLASPLPPGAKTSVQTTWTTGPAGEVTIGATVDTGGALTEENEGNNATSKLLTVYTVAAGVAATDLTPSVYQPFPDTAITLTAEVTNNGGSASAGNHTVEFYHGNPSGAGVLIGSGTITDPIAGTGGTATVAIGWTTPSTPQIADLYAVVEGTEFRYDLTVTNSPDPDFAVYAGDIALSNNQPVADEVLNISATIRNLAGSQSDALVSFAYNSSGLWLDLGTPVLVEDIDPDTQQLVPASADLVAAAFYYTIRVTVTPFPATINDANSNDNLATTSFARIDAPLAHAGPDQLVFAGDTVTLDGSGSLNVGSYEWLLLSAPASSTAALDDPAVVDPQFTADLPGTYLSELVVSNGGVHSPADSVTVTAVTPTLSVADLDEELPADTLAGTFTATGGSGYTWALVAGSGDTDNALFTIDGSDLKVATPVDYETQTAVDIRVSLTDPANGLFLEAPFSLAVNPVNDNTPVADAESFTLDEGATATEADLDSGATLLDGDTDADLPNDILTIDTTPATPPAHGSLTLNADGTFSYTHDDSETTSDSFAYTLRDEANHTTTGTVTITVNLVNENSPVANADAISVLEGGTATTLVGGSATLLDNDTDIDTGDVLSVDTPPLTLPSHGVLTLNSDGTFSYTHDDSENMSDSFTYRVRDAADHTAIGTVNIVVTPVNDNTPTGVPDSIEIDEGDTATSLVGGATTLQANDPDVDLPNDTLTVDAIPVAPPAHGSLTLNSNGTFSYAHDDSENFSDSFTYQVRDEADHTATATVTITINPLNENDPVPDPESFTLDEGATATQADLDDGTTLLDGDTDEDTGDTLTIDTTPVAGPSHGSLTLNADGTFSYTHDDSENLTDSFTYQVRDAADNTATATVTITVNPVNDNSPTAVADSIELDEGATATSLVGGATALQTNDTDTDLPEDTLTVDVTPVTPPSYGILTLNANGTFSYVHDDSENFTDSFTYQVRDEADNTSTATVTITINPVNDNDPVADAESFTLDEGATAIHADLDNGATLLDGDTDVDLPHDTLTIDTTPVTPPAHGSLTLSADGTFSYTHDDSENFTDSFTYRLRDEADHTTTATVTITIDPVNDNDPAPDAESFSVDEGGTATHADLDEGTTLLDGDTDVDLPHDTITFDPVPVSGPNHGNLTLNADGTFSYTHDDSENLTDSFTYQIRDEEDHTATATVTITINPVNDNSPTAVADSIELDEGATATSLVGGATTLQANDPDLDLPEDTLTVDVTPVTPPSYGILTLNANGTFSYAHDDTENFTDSFTYQVRDEADHTSTATVTITINPVNDNDPVADTESFSLDEGATATQADLDVGTTLLDGDTDADLPHDALTIDTTPVAGPSHGSLTLNADGTFSYTHDDSENFTDSFTYRLRDEADHTVDSTVTITINPINENTPVPDTESFSVDEGATATHADLDAGATLLEGDTDEDTGDTLTIDTTPVSGPSHGSLSLNADGTFSYTHDDSENLSDSFTYQVRDEVDHLATATVTITINPVNDNDPVADAESFTIDEGATATQADLDAGTNLLDGDTDIDLPEDTLTVDAVPVAAPAHGSLTLNSNGTFSYTHDDSENFSDSFTYQVRDEADHTSTATVTITINPVNDNDPVPDPESFTLEEGATATQADLDDGTTLLDGDTDEDTGDTLTIDTTPVSGPSHGNLTLNADGTFSYTHDDSENLTDSFTYQARDEADHTAQAVVTITINPVNDNSPTGVADSIEVDEGATATSLVGGATALQANDTDLDLPEDTLTVDVTPVTPPSYGILTLNANGTFSYVHDDSENLTDSFTYQVRDEADHTSTATVTITINPVNDNDPVADTESFTLDEGATATHADLDAGATLLDGDTDVDLPHDTLTIDTTPVTPPAHGSLTLGADGTFSYTHDDSENFNDSFTYRLRDESDHTTTATVTITIDPVNENDPVADTENFTLDEGATATHADLDAGATLLDGDTDVDLPHDVLTIDTTPVTPPAHGSLTLSADGTFSYTHDDTENFTDSFTYRLRDEVDHTTTATVTITIDPVNDNDPVADAESVTLDEGATATHADLDAGATLLDGDTDVDLPHDALTVDVTPVTPPAHGSLTLNADGTFSYTHDDTENFTDSFTYQVRDEADHTATATVTITIDPVNDNTPVADAESFSLDEGATATHADLDAGATLLDGDTDIDLPHDALTIDTTPVTPPAHGSLTLNADGTFSYTHDDSESFTDSFTYQVRDEADHTATATVTITIDPVNDNTPVADAESFTLDEGATATHADLDAGATLLDGDTDVDLPHDALTIDTTPVTPPAHGSLTLNADGTFSYTHDDSENFTDSFTYRLRDEADHTTTATVTITIDPVNDNTPVADAESFTLDEGATATHADLDAGATLLDGDTDVDLPHDALTIDTNPVTPPTHGSLTLNADGTFSYTHDDSENFTDSFTYQVRDEADQTATATVTITIDPVNDNDPVADAESFTLDEGATATHADLDAGTTLLDGDTDVDLPHDALTIDTTPVTPPAHGSLTLNADGTFSYTHDDSENFIDSFTYQVRDEADHTATATVSITIDPVNDNTPVADAESFTLDEGATATQADLDAGTTLLDGDTDVDLPNDTLTVDIAPVTPPTHGSLTLGADGTFEYIHDDSENFTDSFTYQVRDEADHTTTATVTITIDPVNDNTPVADAESFTLDEGATATHADLDAGATLLDGDTDVDLPHDALTIDTTPVTPPTHGSLTLNADGTFSYTHDDSENFTDSFTYQVRDEADHTATATVTITIIPVNDNTPVADAESFTLDEGATATHADLDAGATLLDGDTDVDLPHDALTIDTTPVTPPTHGSLTLNADGTFSYTHDDSENFTDSFTYRLRDEVDHTTTATVTITIDPVNDNTPVADAESFTLDEGATATHADLDAGTTLLDGDTDVDLPHDALTIDTTPVTPPAHGSLTLNADGTFSYTHDDSENFTDSFTYQVRDEADHTTTATVTITIDPVNDNTPVADAESFTLDEGATATHADLDAGTTLLDGDTDVDLPHDALTIDTTPVTPPAHGSLTLNADGTFSYTHNDSENFTDSFTYRLRDEADHTTTATVTITIDPVNDNTPVADAESFTLDEGATATHADLDAGATLLDGDTDIDLPHDALTIDTTPVTPPAHGSLTLNADGTFSYTHDDSENFTDSFTYRLRDEAAHTTTATVTITIDPVNDNTPVANADSITVDEGGTATTLDGGATSVLVNDSDADLPGDTLTAVLDDNVDHGTLTLNADGTFSYVHDDGEDATDSFSYHVHDGINDSTTVTVSITITPVNDNTPTANAEAATVAEGGTATTLDGGATSVLANDTDLDLPDDTLTVNTTPVTSPTHGILTLNADGTFSYDHDDSENFTDSFSYEVSDAEDHTAQATVTITITPVNDNTPVADAESFTLDEGATATHAELDAGATLLDGDTDVDLPHDTLSVDTTPVTPPTYGSLTLNANGTFEYIHDDSENFSDSFTYRVRDEADHTADATVTITITPVNDNVPIANPETITVGEGGTATALDGGATSVLTNDTDADKPGDTLTAVLDKSVDNGSLTLNPDGTFSYTHNGSQVFSDDFRYHVHDGVNDSPSLTVNITILQTPPQITSALTASGDQNKQFTYLITANHHPASFNATNLPAGLSIDTTTGLITGQPTASGITNVTISATNSGGTDQETLAITIRPEPPVITSALSATGTRDAAFNYQITATNSPASYNATGLPAGLSVNTGTGLISGTPTGSGTTAVTISATNAGGTGEATLTLLIRPPAPTITSALTASGTVDQAFSYQITASESPQTFAAIGLPAGLAINPTTGLISGIPTVDGVFSVVLEADNGYGTGRATLTLTISPLPPAITSKLTASGRKDQAFSYLITATNSPTSYNATGLPAGLSVNTSTGEISGTPTATGNSSIIISATNAGGTGNATLTLTIMLIDIEWVRIGDPGNNDDTADGNDWQDGVQRYGGVATEFDMAKFEITNADYVAFLNAVAANDTHDLYGEHREWAFNENGILRQDSGEPMFGPPYTYSVKPGHMADKPVNFIDIYDAMRFANWLHNGQPSGPQNNSTTEDGAYDMDAPSITRKAGAKYWVPDVDEWYKAAYYDPSDPGADAGGNANYWSYPTQSDSTPTQATADSNGNINNDTGNIANYGQFMTLWQNTYLDPEFGFPIIEDMTVTTVGSGGPGSESHYGAADMGGNVAEWTEDYFTEPFDPSIKMWIIRGGNYQYTEYFMTSASIDAVFDDGMGGAQGEGYHGFRIARAAPDPDIPDIKPPFHATATSGVAFSYQVQASGVPDSYGASGLPAGLSINTSTGQITGTTTATGVSSVTLSATNVDGTGQATLTLTVNPPTPEITEPAGAPPQGAPPNGPDGPDEEGYTASGFVGQAFSYQIEATNNPTNYNASGLPGGLGVNNATGVISGTPVAEGVTEATIGATNGTGTGFATLTITIGPPLPEITSALSADATEGQPFVYQIVASGSPTSYNATGLPAGLSVNTGTGLISGTPASTGSSSVTISATNTAGSGLATLDLTVHDPIPVITSIASAAGQTGQAFSHQVTATGNPTSYNASGLPTGLGINTSTGEITGTPGQYGFFPVILTASNGQGTGGQNLSLTIGAGATTPVITSPLTAQGMLGQAFTYQVTADNSPTSFAASGLPAGLGINTATGVISGTPTTLGPASAMITATNAAGSDNETLVITTYTDYPGWASVVFDGPGEDNPAISGPQVDFDGDGILNGMEYAVGLDPKLIDGPAAAGGLIDSEGQIYHHLTYNRLLYTVDTTLTPQVSSNLQLWQSGPLHTTEADRVDNGDGTETITVITSNPINGTQHGFLRLHLQLTPP